MLVIHLLVAIVTLMIFAMIINIIIICCWPWLVLMLRVYLHHCMTIMIVMIMTMITTISNDYRWVLLSRPQDSLGDLGSHILMRFFWTISFSLASLETAKRIACTHSVAHVLIQKETQFTAPVTPVSLKIKAQADLSCLFMAIHNLSEQEVKKYEEAFRPLDKDGSGVGCVQTRVFFFVWWLVSLHGWRGL